MATVRRTDEGLGAEEDSDGPRPPDRRLADLIDAGLVRPARTRIRRLPEPVAAAGTVSDLLDRGRPLAG